MTSAVIFDMDGTLTDTEHIWDVVRRELAAADGLLWPDDASEAMMGMSTQEWSVYMAERVGLPGGPEAVAERTIDALAQRYRRHLPTLPGAADAVHRMAAHWPIGVASSSPRVLIETGLQALGVRAAISVVRSTEEGSGRGKPAPDAFLAVAAELGAEPSSTVVVEDSANGIMAGLNAGMCVVAVPPHFLPPSNAVLNRAAVVLDSLDELTPELVAGLTS